MSFCKITMYSLLAAAFIIVITFRFLLVNYAICANRVAENSSLMCLSYTYKLFMQIT